MLTLEMCENTMAQILAEKGENFVYNPEAAFSCYYAPIPTVKARVEVGSYAYNDVIEMEDHNAPGMNTGCAVGEIISRNDLMTDEILTCGKTVDEVIAQGWLQVADEETELYLKTLQRCQDQGNSWGYAAKSAKDAVK